MDIVHHPGTFSLVPNALSCSVIDSDIPTTVSSTDDADSLALAFLASILFETLFLFWLS